jgi:hypothetical protein
MRRPATRPLSRWFWPLPRLLAGLAALALVIWEGFQGRYSTGSHASVLAVIAGIGALALLAGRGRQRSRSSTWLRGAGAASRVLPTAGRARTAAVAGAIVWVLLITATVGWDAASFAAQSRALPTLSRLFGDVTDHGWGRALVFAAWLALGVYLALGCRRPLEDAGVDRSNSRHHAGAPTDRAGASSPDDAVT